VLLHATPVIAIALIIANRERFFMNTRSRF